MKTFAANSFAFGEFELDAEKRRLLKQGKPLALNSKTFDLLLTLVENRGRVLSKEDLLNQVWAGQFVEENNLTVQISALRKVFGEKKGEHQFIVTVPGKGYKFVAELSEPPSDEIVFENHSFSRILVEEEVETETGAAEPTFARRPETHDAPRRTKTRPAIPIFLSVAAFAIAAFLFWFWNGANENPVKSVELKKLTSSGKVAAATLTPDGKYAVFAQTETGGESLWLRQIETGSQTQILPAKAIEYIGLTVSPDGNLIYATVFSGAMSDPQIWKMPLLGGAVEEIKNIKTGIAVAVSPDGKRLAFTESRSDLKETHFGVADADGANKQILLRASDEKRSFPNFDANPAAWSPDGKEIACAVQEKTADGATKSAILLINPANGSERFFGEERWSYVENLTWIDAENLAFITFESNSRQGQIWTISRRTAKARRLTNDHNSYSWLSSANGDVLTVQRNIVSTIRIADFDWAAKSFKTRDVLNESGYISNVAWGNSGEILYSSTATGKSEIWRAGADGAVPSQLTAGANNSRGMTVSPVDGSIVFSAAEDGRHSLFIADGDGKDARRLFDGAEDVFPNFTPDGRAIIFQRGVNNKALTLWRYDLSDGKLARLTENQASFPAVSPDGSMTAYYFMDKQGGNLWRIGLISNSDGAFLRKLNLPPETTDRRMRWHPNGQFIAQTFYEGETANLFLIPIDGGEPQTIKGLGRGDVNWFEWSKDGSQILVSQNSKTEDIVSLKLTKK